MALPPTTPAGVRDYSPEHSAAFYRLEAELMRTFEQAGYRRVLTPAFELAHVFERGLGPGEASRLFRLVDPQNGDVLALRSDITPQIARLIAGPLASAPLPARLCYFGRVFRLQQHSELRRREVAQAGVELLGAAGAEADVEVLSLCDAALCAAGPGDHRLSVGHMGVLRAAFDGLDEEASADLRSLLRRKDQAGVLRAAVELGLPEARANVLGALACLYGEPVAVLERARALADDLPGMTPALDRLAEVLAGLHAQGIAERVLLDLGEMLGFGYYTGIVFHAYLPGVGQAVASGGRYDELVRRFGRDLPAAGFAIDEEGLTQARAG